MNGFKEYAEKELISVQNMINLLGAVSKPDGNYESIVTKKGVNFYRRSARKNGARTRTLLSSEEIASVKTARYKFELLKRLNNNKSVLKNVAKSYLSCKPDDIISSLPKVYKPSIEEMVDPEFRKGLYLCENLYPKKRKYKANIVITEMVNKLSIDTPHFTTMGCIVRSKSEALIGSILESKGISYLYDRLICLEGAEGQEEYKSPDFIIICPDGFVFCWEHFGLLSRKEYSLRGWEKLYLYAINNITPGNNLILTSDDQKGSINCETIARIVDALILPHYKKANDK